MVDYIKVLKCSIKLMEYILLKKIFFFSDTTKFDEKIKKYEYRLNKLTRVLTYYEDLARDVAKKGMGKHSYLCDYVTITSKDTTIGSYVSVADNASIGTTHHPTNWLSTHPFCYFSPVKLTKNSKQISFDYITPCKIGNDVWIGKSAIIMDGITVGDGAIIGANAVVTHDVPPYAIVAGVPARVLKYRFDEDTIKDLLELKWWELDEELIADLPFNDIHACIKKLKEIRSNL